jgi:hypothetical protein
VTSDATHCSSRKETFESYFKTGQLELAARIITAIALLIFIGDFILGLDPGSGARTDLYIFHLPAIYSLHTHPWLQELRDYPSATTPLFQMLMSVNPLLGHDTAFRISSLVFSFLIYGLYVFALWGRFAGLAHALSVALMFGAALLLSPYFESTTYWVNTDTLPLFLMLVAFFLMQPIQDHEWGHGSLRYTAIRIVLIALAGWGAFYTRQSYVFLPIYLFVLLYQKLPSFRMWTASVFLVAGLPGLALFIYWKGFTPPAFQSMHQGFSPMSVVYPLTMIAFYSIPFLLTFGLARKDRAKGSPLSRTSWAAVGLGAFAFLLVFHKFTLVAAVGGGIASKVFARCGRFAPTLFLIFAYLGLLVIVQVLRVTGWRTRALLILFFLPTLMMKVFYERYYDPVLYTVFFLFCDRSLVRRFANPRVGIAVAVFMGCLLGGAVLYHSHDNPIFPLYGSRSPWEGMRPTGDTGLPYN